MKGLLGWLLGLGKPVTAIQQHHESLLTALDAHLDEIVRIAAAKQGVLEKIAKDMATLEELRLHTATMTERR